MYIARQEPRQRTKNSGIGASGIYRGAKPYLPVSMFERNALWGNVSKLPGTEARVRSSSEESAVQAEPERLSGIRTRVHDD